MGLHNFSYIVNNKELTKTNAPNQRGLLLACHDIALNRILQRQTLKSRAERGVRVVQVRRVAERRRVAYVVALHMEIKQRSLVLCKGEVCHETYSSR